MDKQEPRQLSKAPGHRNHLCPDGYCIHWQTWSLTLATTRGQGKDINWVQCQGPVAFPLPQVGSQIGKFLTSIWNLPGLVWAALNRCKPTLSQPPGNWIDHLSQEERGWLLLKGKKKNSCKNVAMGWLSQNFAIQLLDTKVEKGLYAVHLAWSYLGLECRQVQSLFKCKSLPMWYLSSNFKKDSSPIRHYLHLPKN